jgi:hypothetical protein
VSVQEKQKEAFDYIDRWKKERSFYAKAIMDLKTNTTWPYISSQQEKAYEIWKQKVTDPATQEYYKGRDTADVVVGDKVETKAVELEVSETVRQIERVRTEEGQEFLVTKGRLTGYSEFGKERTYDYSKKEMYIETLFHFETEQDPNVNRMRQVCKGPSGLKEHYLLPFTPANLDKLWAKRDKKHCLLVVYDTVTQNSKAALDYEMFKTKSFDYIMNMEYLPEKEREEKRKEYEAQQGIQSQQKPRK